MDENFNLILRKALGVINNKIVDLSEYGKFFWIYPFTTENINGYIDLFDLKDKSLLTVGSSADQAINAILKDCKDITILDINPLTKYYFNLKKAGILTLGYEEFCKFFCYIDYPKVFKYNGEAFNIDSYNKLKEVLKTIDYESYLFWDKLFNSCKFSDIRKNLFTMDEDRVTVVKQMNPYLNDENKFNETKIKIKNINPKFIKGDIFKIKLQKKYDNVILSNICAYNTLKNDKELVENLINNLNVNGKILMCYLYDTQSNTKYKDDWDPIYNLKETYNVLGDYITYFESFIGVKGLKFENENIKDSVIVYQKNKKI